MRKHGGTPSRRDKHVTLAAISPPGVARGRFVGGQQSGLAGSKPPPLFTREASSCSSQGRRQGEPWGASPRPSAPTYLPERVSSHAVHSERSAPFQPASFPNMFELGGISTQSTVMLPIIHQELDCFRVAINIKPLQPSRKMFSTVLSIKRGGW